MRSTYRHILIAPREIGIEQDVPASDLKNKPFDALRRDLACLLPHGQMRAVALDIAPDSLAFYDLNMKYVVEPGDFEIMVGNSSRDADLQKVILTVTK